MTTSTEPGPRPCAHPLNSSTGTSSTARITSPRSRLPAHAVVARHPQTGPARRLLVNVTNTARGPASAMVVIETRTPTVRGHNLLTVKVFRGYFGPQPRRHTSHN